MPTNYERGRGAEYRAAASLKRLGFATVRAASSHGPFDVCGVRGDCVALVQVKQGGKPSPGDYAPIVTMEAPPDAVRLALWYPPASRFGYVLYSSVSPLPEWCGMIRWLPEPPKQKAFRGI